MNFQSKFLFYYNTHLQKKQDILKLFRHCNATNKTSLSKSHS